MEKSCKFSYSDLDDSLIISCREENENVRENFMFDDLIFSLTGKGKIVGLQIRNASNLLEESGVDSKILESLNDIKLAIIKKENSLFISLGIFSQLGEKKLVIGRVFMPQIAK